jgi:hypothetical protein
VGTSVYIETTIISYLTARPSRDLIIAAHQQTTSEWWTKVRPDVDCYVSPFVIDEASRGDDEYARKRLDAIAEFLVLEVNPEIESLAQQYFSALNIPDKAKIDAFHLAIAAWHRMDYVLSWNDSIIDEVRRSRLEIENECHGDFAQLYAHALQVQKKVASKIVSRPDPTKMRAEVDDENSAYRQERRL